MKMVRIFFDHIRDRIRLERFRFVRMRVRMFNIWYHIRIQIFKSYIYDVDIQSYLIRYDWHYPYSNPNLTRNIKTNMISVISVRIRSVFIPSCLWTTGRWNPASGAQMAATCQTFESRASISNSHFQTTGHGEVGIECVRCTPDPYAERMFFVRDHRTRATRRSHASDAASASAVNHWVHNTGLAHVTVRGSGVYTPVSKVQLGARRNLGADPLPSA